MQSLYFLYLVHIPGDKGRGIKATESDYRGTCLLRPTESIPICHNQIQRNRTHNYLVELGNGH